MSPEPTVHAGWKPVPRRRTKRATYYSTCVRNCSDWPPSFPRLHRRGSNRSEMEEDLGILRDSSHRPMPSPTIMIDDDVVSTPTHVPRKQVSLHTFMWSFLLSSPVHQSQTLFSIIDWLISICAPCIPRPQLPVERRFSPKTPCKYGRQRSKKREHHFHPPPRSSR